MAKLYVKICGITNEEDAQVAVAAGADLLGFILYPKSPRYMTPERVQQIVSHIQNWLTTYTPLPTPRFVGVFVNESAARVAEILTVAGLDYAQIHGDESPAFVHQFAPHAFKALRPSNAEEAQAQAESYAALGTTDGPQLLIDAYDPHEYGGTGKKADWHTAAALARRYPRLLLAGGLTPGNVAQAVQTVRPWGVDVSSGVEEQPGRKDHAAVRAFIENAKKVDFNNLR